MSYPLLSLAAVLAVSVSAPALAAPQLLGAVQAAAAAPAAPAKPPTRAEVIRSAGTNFAELDTNKDGSLSKAEVDAAQARSQQRATANLTLRINQEFAKLDTDRSGQLSLNEFRAAAPAIRPNPGASAAAIQRLDANKDGRITPEEFRAPILAGFDRIDTNKDGTISDAERTKAAAARTTTSG